MKIANTFSAFGENKKLSQWAKDDRCKVSYGTLFLRINKYNWDIQKALTEPPQQKNIDLTGRIFGKLKVIKLKERIKNGGSVWFCQCNCSDVKIVEVSYVCLIEGKTKSCGCLYKTLKNGICLPLGQAAQNKVLYEHKQGAKNRNINWNLTDDEALKLFKQNCYYCNEPPSQVRGGKKFNGEYIYNGIDRKDSDECYVPNNVVPCCGKCNKMKLEMKEKDFLDKLRKIYHNMKL